MGLGVGDYLIERKGVQLLVAAHPNSRREEPLPDDADMVLHLPFSQPEAGVQATGSTR